jgi:predicted amidohydrolase YtcJ
MKVATSTLQQVRERGDLLHRVSNEADGPELEAMISGGMATGLGDEWLRLGATYEHGVDGSFSERTMAMSVPYPDSKSGRESDRNARRAQHLV